MQNIAVILAGGRGSRMQLKTNKVLAKICNKPIISYLIDELEKLNLYDIYVVLGNNANEVKNVLPSHIKTVIQEEPLGTGDALRCASKFFSDFEGNILLLNGDGPIVKENTLRNILDLKKAQMKLFVGNYSKNSRFGRIKRVNGAISGIIEAKDCTEAELNIKEQNLGIYCFKNEVLQKYIYSIGCNNNQHEYYVTDLVQAFVSNNYKIDAYRREKNDFYLPSINTITELAFCNKLMQKHINENFLKNGVNIISPASTFIDINSKIWEYTTIFPNVWVEDCIIADNVTIGANCVLINSKIHSGVNIGANSVIINKTITVDVPPLTLAQNTLNRQY